jgi:propanol-preferring alcohol dehydrogenase
MPANGHVLVIGAGGLGGYAIQWLRALSAAEVVVADVAEHRRATARELGADEVIDSDDRTVDAVRDLTRGRGVDAVLDFVGTDDTISIATACARPLGTIALVGAGGGTLGVRWGALPLECDVFIPQGGTHPELYEVVDLAQRGLVRSNIQRFDFTDTVEAYERLRRGDLEGRAVVVPS